MEAEITLNYNDEQTAEAVFDAIVADNFKTPQDLTVKTTREGSTVSTFIQCEKGFATFIATIDDLLFSVAVAERVVQVAKKF